MSDLSPTAWRVEDGLGMSVVDYIDEASVAMHLEPDAIALILTEDSGIFVSPSTIRRWQQDDRWQTMRPGTFLWWYGHIPYWDTDTNPFHRPMQGEL